MSKFYYKVKNKKNEIIEGCINASDTSDAVRKLERKKLTVLAVNELITADINKTEAELKEKTKFEFSLKEKKEFFSSLYMLYTSEISIKECFQTIIKTVKNKNISHYCTSVLRFLDKGLSLSETLKKIPPKPGIAYTALLAAGDESGTLETVLFHIQKNIKKEEAVKHELISSLTYPCCMFVFAIVVFLFFKFFVLKVFEIMAEDVSSLSISEVAVSAGLKIAGVLIIIAICVFILIKNKKLLKAIIGFILKFPVLSGIVNDYEYMNYFAVFSLAYEAGIPVTEALKLSDSVIKTKSRRRKLLKAESMTDNGCELATALAASSCFSSSIISRIAAGEKSGKLDKAFSQISSNFEKTADFKIKTATKMLEPVMMIFIGIMVAYIAYKAYTGYYKGLFSGLGISI